MNFKIRIATRNEDLSLSVQTFRHDYFQMTNYGNVNYKRRNHYKTKPGRHNQEKQNKYLGGGG